MVLQHGTLGLEQSGFDSFHGYDVGSVCSSNLSKDLFVERQPKK